MKLYNINDLPGSQLIPFSKYSERSQEETENLVKSGFYPVPIITENKIIWGNDVIECGKKLGVNQLWCRSVPDVPLENLLTALKLENRKNNYLFREKSEILKYIEENALQKNIPEISSCIQDDGDFTIYTLKYDTLSKSVRDGIDANFIDIKSGVLLKDLPEKVFTLLFQCNKISFSTRRIILKEILEISRRDSLDENQTIKLAEELTEKENPADAAAKIRYPKMESMKDTFAQYINTYIKGSGITLEAPQGFEGSSFTAKFQIKSAVQLERVIKTLGKVKESAEELFKLL